MAKRHLTGLLLGFVFAATSGHAAQVGQCQSLPGGLSGTYCVYPGDPRNDDIVYFLPAEGSDAQSWGRDDDFPEQVRQHWSEQDAYTPTVISVVLGSTWILAPKNAAAASGLLDTFTQKVIPAIEATRGGLKGVRVVVGQSLGGFNAIQLGLRTTLFAKIASLCAPMATDLTPFATDAQIDAHIAASSVYRFLGSAGKARIKSNVQNTLNLLKTYYPTPSDWNGADPLHLASNANPGPNLLEIQVQAGFHDTFALYEGNNEFAARLIGRGVQVDWRPQTGGHCSVDINTLADFLAD